MKSQYDLASSYLSKVPPPVQGSRNDTLNKTAFALVERFQLSEVEFTTLLGEWNSRCSPPLGEAELRQTLTSAWNGAYGRGVAGTKARTHSNHAGGHSRPPVRQIAIPTPPPPPEKKHAAPKIKYDVSGAAALPDPVPDGARALLSACFAPGEGIRIAPAELNDDGKEVPDGGGVCFSREEWLNRLNQRNGDPNQIFSSTDKTGIYIGINPYRVGCTKDSDVTSFRHALVEFDHGISPPEQFNLYQQSRLPCDAIIYSGGKSVHAWVRVDAKDRKEYDERVSIIYGHFAAAGLDVDIANKNPGRLSRLPHCVRFGSRQELLALHSGCESWSEWVQFVDADNIGKCDRFEDLSQLDTAHDPNCVVGFADGNTTRYLCKGKSAWLLGPSGIGKSSLVTEFALGWALGRPVFGITPARPLKSLVVQAENDRYDLAEMVQGICRSHNLDPFTAEAEWEMINQNLKYRTETTGTGELFVARLHRLIDRERPDVVWIDPLLSFAGIDVSRQDEVSHFLRELLNPMLEATGVVLIGVHHTGKPKNARDTANWTNTDWAYSGLGSSELVNWARAVMLIRPVSDFRFELMMVKRGSRARAKHPDGSHASSVFLQHGKGMIKWEQLEPPKEGEEGAKKEGQKRESKVGQPSFQQDIADAPSLVDMVLDKIPADGESENSLAKRISGHSKKIFMGVGVSTAKKIVGLVGRKGLIFYDEEKDLYFRKKNV